MKRFLTALAVLLLSVSSAQAGVRRLEIPNGWYGDNRPDGKFAVLVTGTKIQTDSGDIALPGYNVLFPRIPPQGEFKVAGQNHGGNDNLEWVNGEWHSVGASYGVSPVIYDWNGVLHQNVVAFGSQGLRYVAYDNTLVTGDQTYVNPALGLYEFTTYGDISIGQGGNGGAIAVRGTERRVIEPGDTRAIRYLRIGDHIAVSIWKLAEAKNVLLWFDAGDLSSFPLEVPPAPAPKPNPTPAPLPNPAPEPPPVPDSLIAPNRLEVVADVIAAHPEINACDEVARGTIVDYAAQRLNAAEGKTIWGRKSRNSAGTDLNTDGLTFKRPDGRFEIYDAISGGTCKATWEGYGPFRQGENGYWVPPVLAPEGGAQVPPPPSEDPVIAQLKARIAALDGFIATLNTENAAANQRISELEAERDDLKAQLETVRKERDELLNKPAPTCEAKVPGILRALGIRVGCTVK